MRILARPRSAFWLLLALSPAIPELMTGSTSLNGLVVDPVRFAVQIALLLGLYGAGCVVIREFCVILGKGWTSILLLGAAYGILEEGVAVHTFFLSSGNPVNSFATYGRLFGVNWLWALGLTIFHATYSIALPILLVHLAYPAARGKRWLDRGALALTFGIYVAVVALLAVSVPQGPSPLLLVFFLALVLVLVGAAILSRPDTLSIAPGPARLGPKTLLGAGAISFAVWVLMTLFAATSWLPAFGAASILVLGNGVALGIAVYGPGAEGLERSELLFATGMVAALWGWDLLLLAGGYGAAVLIVGVSAYLLSRLWRRVFGAPRRTPIASGPSGGP